MKSTFFIDESGNPGVADHEHPYFTMVAVQVVDELTQRLIDVEMTKYKQELGWAFKHEFKFSHTRKELIVEMMRRLEAYDYRIYAVTMDKRITRLYDRRSVYNETLKSLLHLAEETTLNIVIDGQAGKKHRKNILTYLRQNLAPWQHVAKLRFCDSRSSNLVQLADLVVGIIARVQCNSEGNQRLYNLIKNKITKLEQI